ncbi:hypothetical protein J6590_011605 [Homalodisca vitripennis]|nr:hypothetical protein J6590_011605 [Homalodisca vitripennis]
MPGADWELTDYRLKECSDEAVTKGEGGQVISSNLCRLFKIIRLKQPTHYVIWGENELLLIDLLTSRSMSFNDRHKVPSFKALGPRFIAWTNRQTHAFVRIFLTAKPHRICPTPQRKSFVEEYYSRFDHRQHGK